MARFNQKKKNILKGKIGRSEMFVPVHDVPVLGSDMIPLIPNDDENAKKRPKESVEKSKKKSE